jgi:hypothetical protein
MRPEGLILAEIAGLEEGAMREFCIILLIAVYSCFMAFAQEQDSIKQKDIDEFLAFADDYRTLAEKYIKDAKNKSVSDIFYSTENDKWLGQTELFLKKAGWSFDKMNQFLYTVYLALLAVDYAEQYGDLSDDNGGKLFSDIPDSVKELVKANRKKLDAYFPKEDYSGYSEETGEPIEGGSASGDTGAAEEAGIISGDIKVEVTTGADVKVKVVFTSDAQELVVEAVILKAGKEVVAGEQVTVMPWTVKGGHVEKTWTFSKGALNNGSYAASVTITDPDGTEVGSKTADFTVK